MVFPENSKEKEWSTDFASKIPKIEKSDLSFMQYIDIGVQESNGATGSVIS